MLEHRQPIVRGLFGILAVLALLSALTAFLRLRLPPGDEWKFFGFLPLFELDSESNIPTWYSSSLLLVCSALLGWIAREKTNSGDRFRVHWWILSAGFVYLSMDETAMIHENFIAIIHFFGSPSGVFFFAWVVPALILLPFLGLAYLKFLRHLPGRIRAGFLISAAFYLGGAIGMEMIGASYSSRGYPHNSFSYTLITHIEEVLELCGIILFVRVLLNYMARPSARPSPAG